jgi:PadR family transcriptional regulator PadR
MFQLGSALLDGCVLAVLSRGDAYGYSLTQEIKRVINVSESTLYPVLRRLQKEDCLSTYDQPQNGRNRRYYRITKAGAARLGATVASWETFKTSIDTLLVQNETPTTGGEAS